MIAIYRIVSPSTTSDFDEYYKLRWELLRQQWNQPIGSEKDELESQSIHYSVRSNDDDLIGVCRMHFSSDETAQIRFMAVKSACQGLGIGSSLLQKAENDARLNGIKKILLQSRETAVYFYQKQGYEIIEKTFLLYGTIQHFLMQKQLF